MELPREKPDKVLSMYAGVAGLRILVVGGDGSVGWVMSCLDALGDHMRAAGEEHWRPPPIAVLPLGTGATSGRSRLRAEGKQSTCAVARGQHNTLHL